MSILCLDLSTKCTGWTKFTKDGKLKKRGQITPAKDIDIYHKIQYVTDQIKSLYSNVDTVVIEGLYYGKNVQSLLVLARLSGAVIYSWMSYKFKLPIIYTASHARKLAGIKGNSHKAEIQVYVIKKYKYAPKKVIEEYEEVIAETQLALKNKKIKRSAYKYRLTKLSKRIDEETGISEDQADAVILGLAFAEENK